MTTHAAPLENRQSSKDRSDRHSTVLRGRRLFVVRLAWLLAVLLFVSLYVSNTWTMTAGVRYEWLVGDARSFFAERDSFETFLTYLTTLRWTVTGVFAITALFIAWRRSTDWLVLFVSFALLATPMMLVHSVDISHLRYPSLLEFIPGIDFLTGSLASVLMFSSFLLLFHLFPDGRFYPRWTRWFFLPMIGVFVLFGLSASPQVQLPDWLEEDWTFAILLIIFLLNICTGLYGQFVRYRRVASPVQRQQTKLVLFALAFQLVALLFTFTFGWNGRPATAVINLQVNAIVPLLVPLAIAVSTLRYRLWDADLILNRALVYGALTAALILLYVASIVLLQALFGRLTGESQSPLVTVLSTLVIAAAFLPMRRRIQRLIDRRFYRRKYDAARTLAAFNETIRDEVELEVLTAELLHVVKQTMQPEHVSLWLKPSLGPATNGRLVSNNARHKSERQKEN